jgi:colanic acid biosynthesis glycosyl transferase WcaI
VKTFGYKSRQFAVEQYAFEQALNQYESLFYSLTAQRSAIEPVVVSKQEV